MNTFVKDTSSLIPQTGSSLKSKWPGWNTREELKIPDEPYEPLKCTHYYDEVDK